MYRSLTLAVFSLLIPLQALMVYPAYCGESRKVSLDKTFRIDTRETFIVDMDITAGEVKVTRSGSFDECRVRIDYTPEKFSPCVDFTENGNCLGITIGCSKLFKNNSCENNTIMELVIELPYGPPVDLRGELKAGEAEFRLGDLCIERFRFRSLAGETTVRFDEPNRIECKRFEIGTTIGETEIIRLGNSRFVDARINGGIGEMKIDFRGLALNDSQADIDLDLGETNIIVPENSGTKISVSRFLVFKNADCPNGFSRRGGSWYSDNYDTNNRRLAISLTPGMGKLNIRHGKD